MHTECYCTQFRRAIHALTRAYDNELQPVGLRITQLSVLRALARLKEASITELASELSLNRTTISRNLKPLFKAGWIKIKSSADKRECIIKLNKSGYSVLKQANPYWNKAQKLVEKIVKPYMTTKGSPSLINVLENLQLINLGFKFKPT